MLEDGNVAELGERVALVANPASMFSQLLAQGLDDQDAVAT